MYIPFDQDVPAGTDTPPIYAGDDLSNIRALRDAVVCGFMPGWSYALDVADPPAYAEWTHPGGQIKFRMIQTYGSGTPAFSDSVRWDYSENAGGAWSTISTGGTPSAITTNSIGSILTVDKDAGMWVLAISAFNRNRFSEYSTGVHIGSSGTAVHGLGTMATQNADAVAISGGSVANVKAELLDRLTPDWPADIVAGAWDWAATPTMVQCTSGIAVSQIDNPHPGEMKRIHVYTAGAITLPAACIYATGHPVWGTTGTMVNLIALNGGGILVTTIPF